MLETSARLLRLLSFLQAHRDWSGAELARRLHITERTVRRDVDRLRTLGYEVDAVPGVGGGYRLGLGSAMPPLLLADEEAVALAVGLRSAATSGIGGIDEAVVSAMTKLERTLPSRLRHRVSTLQKAIVALPGGGAAIDVEVLLGVSRAIADRESLRVRYQRHDGVQDDRTLEPHRVVLVGRRWYLIAWDTARDDWRTFRLDRMSLRTPNGPRFTPRPPPEGDVLKFAAEGVTNRAYRYQCRVTVHASAEIIAEHFGPSIAVVTAIDERSCQVSAGTDRLAEMAGYLAMTEHEFTVEEPAELRAAVKAMARRLGRAAPEKSRQHSR